MKNEKGKNKNNFWSNGFTVDETKFSTLTLLLVTAFTYLLITNIINDYIFTDRVFDTVKWLIGGIVGVNGIDTFGKISNNNNKK